MKNLKVLLSLVVIMAVLLAAFLPVSAIDFVAEDIYAAVFVIYSDNALGSGFAIGKECIITNAHVITNPDHVVVKNYAGQEYTAFVVGMDSEKDIAVLSVPDITFPFLSVADISTMHIGDDIYAIGAPKSMSYTLTKGVISAKEREIGKYKYIQIDAALSEGNSGGPLLNATGHVLGINTMKMNDSEGIGLAIPINTVLAYLSDLGLILDENGNISGDINPPDKQEESFSNVDAVSKTQHSDTPLYSNWALVSFVVAILSVFGNIILSILLIYQRKKNLNLKYDPKERTDFEIDILE